jgi:DNA-directed RNA polymerase specialized sigma24 family protein
LVIRKQIHMTISEEDDFDAFFFALYPRARALAAKVLASREDAEDVAAEAMARACARWRRLRELPHREGWLLRVTLNVAVDTLRKRRELSVDPDPPKGDPVDSLALRGAVRNLPRRQREVVGLRYFADMTEAQVASTLGISGGAVKRHAHRGIARLREMVDWTPGDGRSL